MDFKISAGSGKRGRCPNCNKKVLNMIRNGVKMVVCSCGWKQIISKYPNNNINTQNITKR